MNQHSINIKLAYYCKIAEYYKISLYTLRHKLQTEFKVTNILISEDENILIYVNMQSDLEKLEDWLNPTLVMIQLT